MYFILDILMFCLVLALSIYTIKQNIYSLSSFGVVFIWVFNFLGLVALRLGYDAQTFQSIVFDWTSAEISRGFVIATIGMISLLSGILIASPAKTLSPVGDDEVRPEASLVNYQICYALAVVYALLCLILPGANTFSILASFRSAGAADLYDLRSQVDISRVVTQVDYVLISIPSLVLLRRYFIKNTNLYFIVAIIAISAIAKLAYFQKQALLLFLIQVYLVIFGKSGLRVKYIVIAATSYLILLTLMYIVSTPSLVASGIWFTLQTAVERVFLRSAIGYLAVASYVPYNIGHAGLLLLKPWAIASHGHYVDLNNILFSLMTGGDSVGNIAIPAIPWGYAAFGWPGVVLISFFSGIFIAWMDRFAAYVFGGDRQLAIVLLLPIAFYLSESSIFGILSGFGGVIIIIHMMFLSKRIVHEL
jgi:hypothetical protein